MNRILSYIRHYFTANSKKGFGIHSPFMFYLVSEIINDFTPYYCFEKIEKRRKSLKNNKSVIEITDLGAGSRANKNPERTIADIAKNSLKPPRQSQLLFRLVNYFNPKTILELGTSFGITTSYLASVNSSAKVFTLEGCPNISKVALESFRQLRINNTELIQGHFNDTLPEVLEKTDSLDFVFFDGNHKKTATLNYFEQCLPKAHSNSVFVFDDIYLTSDMNLAWEEIKKHPKVKVSLDLFHLGIVFFKDELKPQHFKIHF